MDWKSTCQNHSLEQLRLATLDLSLLLRESNLDQTSWRPLDKPPFQMIFMKSDNFWDFVIIFKVMFCSSHCTPQCNNKKGLWVEKGASVATCCQSFSRIDNNFDIRPSGALPKAGIALRPHHRRLSRKCQKARGLWSYSGTSSAEWSISSDQLCQQKTKMSWENHALFLLNVSISLGHGTIQCLS